MLIDRYYYDFFVDQRRYRLSVPLFLVRLGLCFLKKPDLVLLLDAPAEVLQRRKQEVAPAETERQRAAYRELVGGLPNGRVLDATQAPEKVGADINRAILDFMAQTDPQALGPPKLNHANSRRIPGKRCSPRRRGRDRASGSECGC